ncbi:hypothetical protein GCM10011519_25760 [Marmoricola endophyticus]|uniref:ATP-grasp enzyme n=1 Tax=Marmoricola endophyticus TaxID=2040280 RepID=A0A917F686_9ACTN|nr:ATP-grasp enzyme [Marmoricola endophyticus]GGF50645.1 hypothetical protein GCM10011519_25760 [Marmoricola endophyticus]
MRLRARARTLGALALLTTALPANLVLTGAALARGAVRGRPTPATPARRRTVLLTGGKMTKSLTLARAFHAAGHRVVLAESPTYRLSGHRFSRAVDAFRTIPDATDPSYALALRELVREEGVDVVIPVCSPVSSRYDARAKAVLGCEVLHPDPETLEAVDDKARFAELAHSLGLAVPETHRVSDPEEVVAFDFAAHPGRRYVLKNLDYDPVNRLDLTPLPRPTAPETAALARSKPISADHPWILQELVEGREYCTHGTVRDGRLQVYTCCASSAFQLNYETVDKPAVRAWVERFCEGTGTTGQLSFDLIEQADGTVKGIECNPRTHSAITLFAGDARLAPAYLEEREAAIEPLAGARPTYWTYQEAWRLLRHPGTLPQRWRVVREGRDAIFDVDDPLPFLAVHHLQIPWLLVRCLVRGGDFVRVDVNIGKLVEAGGD